MQSVSKSLAGTAREEGRQRGDQDLTRPRVKRARAAGKPGPVSGLRPCRRPATRKISNVALALHGSGTKPLGAGTGVHPHGDGALQFACVGCRRERELVVLLKLLRDRGKPSVTVCFSGAQKHVLRPQRTASLRVRRLRCTRLAISAWMACSSTAWSDSDVSPGPCTGRKYRDMAVGRVRGVEVDGWGAHNDGGRVRAPGWKPGVRLATGSPAATEAGA
jgi:hypothetical protein